MDRIEWVEIVEPRSREHMYANLTTGECAWEPPPGVKVKRTDENQWWELFDSNTGRFYYYNATSLKTVWHRPHNADIIPLAKLQTLKANTESAVGGVAAASASTSQYYDVPRSPSSSSAHSGQTPTRAPSTPGSRCNSARPSAAAAAQQLVNCQTQTSPANSPHHARRLERASQQEPTCSRAAQPSGSSKHRVRSQHSLPQANGNSAVDQLQDAMLRLQSGEELAAEVQRMFDAESQALDLDLCNQQQQRPASCSGGSQRFPVDDAPLYDAVNDTNGPSYSSANNNNSQQKKSSITSSSSSKPGSLIKSLLNSSTSKSSTTSVEPSGSNQASPIPALRSNSNKHSPRLGRLKSQRDSSSDDATYVPMSASSSSSSAKPTQPHIQYAQNLTSEAKIVSTKRKDPSAHKDVKTTISIGDGGGPDVIRVGSASPATEHTTTIEVSGSSTGPSPVPPLNNNNSSAERRSAPSTSRAAPVAVKEATVTTICGSPRLWSNRGALPKQQSMVEPAAVAQSSSAAAAGSDSPVWTHRNDLSMIKSLDSGIKSCDSAASTAEAQQPPAAASSSSDSQPQQPAVASVEHSPATSRHRVKSSTSRKSPQRSPGSPQPMSLARPYPQIAAHLAFSQEHQQFILDASNNNNNNIMASSEDDEDIEDDDDEMVFADDEVDLTDQRTPPSVSSAEDGSHRRSQPSPSSVHQQQQPVRQHHIAMGVAGRMSDSRLLKQFSESSTSSSATARSRTTAGSNASAGLYVHAPTAPSLPAPPPNATGTLNKNSASLERQPVVGDWLSSYPGDISPPCNRPQSMVAGAQQQQHPVDVLPPNTATLSRPPRQSQVNVSRSASSLSRAPLTLHSSSTTSSSTGGPAGVVDSFAHENLARPKKGFFRKRQSMQSMMSFSKEAIKQPLIMTQDKIVKKEACGICKRIQAYMGDRKVKSGVSIDQLALDICLRGWAKPALRDEIYIQLCKQTTDNPKPDSLRRGWELIAISLSVFSPSPNLQPYLDAYIARNADQLLDTPEMRVSQYAQHCQRKLERAMAATQANHPPTITTNQPTANGRCLRKPTIDDVDNLRVQIFHPSMFANTLDEVMLAQREKFPTRQLPWVQTTLSDLVLQMNGPKQEGIFRVPGDVDEVNVLKTRMDRWLVPSVSDAHVPASLLKLWYRELAEPLIPASFYEMCLQAADIPDEACRLVERLPRLHRLVLAYLIRFLQVFVRPENVASTKMDAANLAMVMAPNLLRCQSDDPRVMFDNTRREMAFIRTLCEHYDTSFMEGVV